MSRELNFIACESSFSASDIVIVGYPYDGTSSYRPGSRFAPSAIREASDGLETYSPYLDLNLEDKKICDEGDMVLPFGEKMEVMDIIKTRTEDLLSSKKKILSLGGEHLITYPIVRQYIKYYPDLIVVHFDAHADLREDYLGEKLSHATVMRRVYEELGEKKIYQFGIRSGTREEFIFGKNRNHFHPFTLEEVKDVIWEIPDHTPIYVTIDLDVLDPSVFPGTGTPEPGGVSFLELLKGIHALRGKNIVGADVVELSPDYDSSRVSNIVAAKIVRNMLLLL